jgi:hypothetical protein
MTNNLLRAVLTRTPTPENITDEERRAVTPPARPNTPDSPLANFVENATEEQPTFTAQPIEQPTSSVRRPIARRTIVNNNQPTRGE